MEIEKYSPKWLLNEIKKAKTEAHALLKIIEFQNEIGKQCNIPSVVGRNEVSEQLAEGCQHPLGCACEAANGFPLTDCPNWGG